MIIEKVKESLKIIKEERKNLERLKKDVEEKGFIKLPKNRSGIRNIEKFHDIRLKKSIIRLKNNISFIKEFSSVNTFMPFFENLVPKSIERQSKKLQIKRQLEYKDTGTYSTEPFLLSIYKDEVKNRIKEIIKNEVKNLYIKLKELENLVYEKNDKNEVKKHIEKTGKTNLTKTGRFWDFLISTTPDKVKLAKYIDIILNFHIDNILSLDEELLSNVDEEFIKKVEAFKKTTDPSTVQPFRTSLILFNQYISYLEKEIILNRFYKTENFNKEYIEFLENIEKIKDRLGLKVNLTKAQSVIAFSFMKDLVEHLKNIKNIEPIKLFNISEVGTGKTFTIPFISFMFAIKMKEKFKNKNPVFFIITEANLLPETKQKLTQEVGLKSSKIHLVEDLNIEQIKLKPWNFYILSRNKLTTFSVSNIKNFAKKCKKENIIVNMFIDEASFLKNQKSKISKYYSVLKTKLIKNRALGFEFFITATPISNDTLDTVYAVNANKKILYRLKEKNIYDDIKKVFDTYVKHFEEDLSFREVLNLTYKEQKKYINCKNKCTLDPKSVALLSVYIYKYKNELDKIEDLSYLESANYKTGIISENKVKNKQEYVKLINCLSELTEFKGIDRIINSDDNSFVSTSSLILNTNLIEAFVFNELIKTSRAISNFQRFKTLDRFVKDKNTVVDEIEYEKFMIRHFLISQILNDLNLIDIKYERKEKTRKNKEVLSIVVDKEHYCLTLEDILNNNPEKVLDSIKVEINPVLFFKMKNIEEQLENENLNNKKYKELKAVLEKIKKELNQDLAVISKNKSDIIETLKSDVEKLRNYLNPKLEFYPVSLYSYDDFFSNIKEKLMENPKLDELFENTNIKESIVNNSSKMINIYSIIFQASESFDNPTISKFIKRASRKLKSSLEEHVSIENFDIDKFTKFIIENGSTVNNLLKRINDLAKENKIPVLITTNYKNSVNSIKNDNNFVITGDIEIKKRKQIINQVNQVENSKSVVATANSILKGISFFFIPYGILPETPKNAEFRTQIAGRLRNLFEEHIKMIEEKDINEKHKKLLLSEKKYFDIVSSEIMLAFPNIQQEKNILIELVKFISQHKEVIDISVEDCVSKSDMEYDFTFNISIVEEYSNIIKNEKLSDFTDYLKTKSSIDTDNLIELFKNYIDKITEKNLKKTSIYKLLGG